MQNLVARGFFFGLILTLSSGVASAASAERASAAAEREAAARSADRVVIVKSRRQMRLYSKGRQIARYYVALGRKPVGTKRCEGDMKTPEGVYRIESRKPDSEFYRALKISYPSARDVARARAAGCSPGGQIMIHGLRPGDRENARKHLYSDWTHGCVAVTNEEIEQIWAMVPDGTPVEILP